MRKPHGFLTLALGRQTYLDQAINLALSVRHHGKLPISVIVDSPLNDVLQKTSGLRSLFDHVMVDDTLPKGPIAKIFVDRHSPYEETVFVDADCLLFGPFAPLPPDFFANDFAVFGKAHRLGNWGPRKIQDLARRAGSVDFPRINSGVFAWRRSARAARIFSRIRQLHQDDPYAFSWDLKGIPGLVNDEPLICAALAMDGVSPISATIGGRHVMLSTINALCFQLDLHAGTVRFLKEGRWVSPWIVHFCEIYPNRHYAREVNALRAGTVPPWTYPDPASLKRHVGRSVRGILSAVTGRKSGSIF